MEINPEISINVYNFYDLVSGSTNNRKIEDINESKHHPKKCGVLFFNNFRWQDVGF